MRKKDDKDNLMLKQLDIIARGISETFAPFCEVVVHDLTNPQHAILSIHNNLSGRSCGDPATELGVSRILDPDYPALIANYANHFSDGRPIKSTSIGIKNESGNYVAALCMNVDVSLFRSMQSALSQFSQTKDGDVYESLEPAGTAAIRQYIDRFAARLTTTPRALKTAERKRLIKELRQAGLLDVKKSIETVASYLGVSRASVYNYAKEPLL